MASPQAENGHLDLANELVEQFFRLQLSGYQWRLLWVILRQTWGWHKKEDRISLSYFEEKTWISQKHIQRAIKELMGMNIIIRREETYVKTFSFQKNYELWKPTPKLGSPKKGSPKLGGPEIGAGETPKKGSKQTPKLGSTKEIKETSQKKLLRDSKKPNPAVKKFIDFWYQSFQSHFGTPYAVNGGKEGKLVKALLATHPLENLKDLAELFFKSNDPFIQNAGYTLGVFSSQVNKLSPKLKNLDSGKPHNALLEKIQEAEAQHSDVNPEEFRPAFAREDSNAN